MGRLETRALSDHVGVEVIGLDLSRDPDPETRAQLWDLFIRHGVLLARGAGASKEAHLAFSRCFGELERHSVRESWVEGSPELVDISYIPPAPGAQPDNQPIYELDGEALAGWLPWHTDQCFMPRLSRGGVIRMIAAPPEKGRTGFIDKIRLYEALPDRLKARIDGLGVVYRFEPRADRHKFGRPPGLRLLSSSAAMDSLVARLERDFPPVVHPMVYRQAETGRRVLNFSPAYALGIDGMDAAESDALLDEITGHCLNPDFAWRHRWEIGDLVVWDNWRTLHNAEGARADQARIVQRTSIAGDYGLGRTI